VRGCIILGRRAVQYNITLVTGRILEITPLQGSPVPCKVRFRLAAGAQGTAVLHLTEVNPAGSAWSPAMRPVVQAWCQRYVGVALAEGGPLEGKG
jgi:hypothetical protein